MSQKGERELLSNAGDSAQEVVLGTPYWTAAESLPQTFVKVVQLLLQPGDVGLDAGTDGSGGAQTVLLRDQQEKEITIIPYRSTLIYVSVISLVFCILFFAGSVFSNFADSPDIAPRVQPPSLDLRTAAGKS